MLTIEQTRFLADGTQDDRVKWKIPINICTKSFPNQSVHQIYLHGVKKQTFLLENIPETDWIKLNVFRYILHLFFLCSSIRKYLVWESIVFIILQQCSTH